MFWRSYTEWGGGVEVMLKMAGSCVLPFFLSFLRIFNSVGRNKKICNEGHLGYFQNRLKGQNRIVINFP